MKCVECGKKIEESEGYVRASKERICLACVIEKMNEAIIKYPISGAGEN